jgi:hypothetical protein
MLEIFFIIYLSLEFLSMKRMKILKLLAKMEKFHSNQMKVMTL